MSLLQVTTPIQDIAGTKHNCFKGYIPTFFELLRQDIPIEKIISQVVGLDLLAKVEVVGTLDVSQNIIVGDFVAINTSKYPNKVAKIVSITIPNKTFVVDLAYIGDDTGGFLNYRKNWFVEYRIVDSDTATGAQTTVDNLFDFVFIAQSEVDGKVELDISVANNKNTPSVDVGLNNDMFLFFKIQWRERYLSFVGLWTSPTVDDAMIVFHASDINKQEGGIEIPFQNNIILSDTTLLRFWNVISPKVNFLRSRLGDADPATTYRIDVKQFDITKLQIQSDSVAIPNLDGLHTIDLSSIVIVSSAVFITFETEFVTDPGEYEEAEYKDDEYNVNI